jgi:hypothetical protein
MEATLINRRAEYDLQMLTGCPSWLAMTFTIRRMIN